MSRVLVSREDGKMKKGSVQINIFFGREKKKRFRGLILNRKRFKTFSKSIVPYEMRPH